MKNMIQSSRTGLSKKTMTTWSRLALGATCAVIATAGLASVNAHATPTDAPWPLAAPHTPAPVFENPGNAPVLATPRVVPILYGADPQASVLQKFYAKLATSTYFASGLGEYGVGKPTFAAPVILIGAAPAVMDDATAASWLVTQISSGTVPAEDGNTVYALVYPSSTTVSYGLLYSGIPSPLCGSTSEATQTSDGTNVPFTMTGLCEGNTGGLSDTDAETFGISSALSDAFTSPDWAFNPGYSDLSWSGSGWLLFTGSYTANVGSLCGTLIHEPTTEKPTDLGYLVPMIWSSQAALGGHDPCAVSSARRETYFNAAPDTAGAITAFGPLKGVILPPGSAVTIPVRLFSDGPIGSWTLGAAERSDLIPDSFNLLSFSFDRASGTNGDVVHLTVKRAIAPDGSVAPDLGFEITSTRGTTVHEWLVAVGNE